MQQVFALKYDIKAYGVIYINIIFSKDCLVHFVFSNQLDPAAYHLYTKFAGI